MNLTTIVVSINAGLVFMLAGLPQLPLSSEIQSIAGFIIGTVIAVIGPLLPKISGNLRSLLSLQRRG